MDVSKLKKTWYKKWWVWLLAFAIFGMIGSSMDDSSGEQAEQAKQEASGDFEANLKLAVEGSKVIATITTNAPDGAVFDTMISGPSPTGEPVKAYPVAKNGKAAAEFDVTGWGVGEIKCDVLFSLGSETHPQPENVLDVYGEKGEKLAGDIVKDVGDGEKIAYVKEATAPYPDAASVTQKQDEYLASTLVELIKSSNGVVLDIGPLYDANDWSLVKVLVSDAWYYSPEHEKERFAQQTGDTVESIIYSSGKIAKDKSIMVYFYDSYDAEIATPKVMGGYKIKK